MAADWIHLHALYNDLGTTVACAENTLPFALRTADYYTLRSEWDGLRESLERMIALRDVSVQEDRDDLARRAWAYHERLVAYLGGLQDTAACAVISFGVEPPEMPTPPPARASSGLGSKLIWGGILAAALVGAGWALTR